VRQTSSTSSTRLASIIPGISLKGFSKRSAIGMKKRLYQYIARSRCRVRNHAPMRLSVLLRGCIP